MDPVGTMSSRCGLAKDLKKYSEKSRGAAKNLEEHSDRMDGHAKNLKNHSKRNVELAKILKRHSERSIKLAQYLREHSEKHTDFAKNLEGHSGMNELTKYLRRNHKFTKNFDGSSGQLQQPSTLYLQFIIGVSSQEELRVLSTLRSVEEESRNADEIRVAIRQAIEGTLQRMERPRSSLVEGDLEDS
ncbi:hypothetical protein BU17DRAFT_69935 [Hysterangium stoloniferum]|nr:hypothetical protein BU17DRAFT_69935 [Hysterangium stoloniferum]